MLSGALSLKVCPHNPFNRKCQFTMKEKSSLFNLSIDNIAQFQKVSSN